MESVKDFFAHILIDLHDSLYLAIGGSLEEETRDWTSRGVELASTGIKILILLSILCFTYWLSIYILKHNRQRLHLNHKNYRLIRSVLRYFWVTAGIIGIMSQMTITPSTIKATAKASIWASIYYMLWASSGQVINKILRHYGLNASIEQLLKNVFSVLIVVMGVASIMAQFGFDIVSLVAGLGIVGLAVGFAAQSTLANFIAGMTILVEQSFQVGDWIHINNKEGRVVLISLRTTHILTRDNMTIILPNATVASSEVTNLTSKNFIRFDIKVRIAFEADMDNAKAVIAKVLEDSDSILKRPEPSITVAEVADFGVYFIVRFWVTPAHVAKIPAIKEDLQETIKKALDTAGISTPYPHMHLVMPKDVDYPITTKPFEVRTSVKQD